MDFYLRQDLKSMVYRSPSANILDLRRKITEAVLRLIVPELLQNASRCVLHRLQMVMEQQGEHIEHLLNR